ncbi:FMP32, mitochondrial-like protein [Tanacetum coccineum]
MSCLIFDVPARRQTLKQFRRLDNSWDKCAIAKAQIAYQSLTVGTYGQSLANNLYALPDSRLTDVPIMHDMPQNHHGKRVMPIGSGNLLENTQRIYHGTYDEMDCYVKRVPVTTMSYAHIHLKLLKSCNEQSNMLRIYDARCDGLHYEIAIEKCSLNLDEFIRRKTKDRRELLRMFREIIRGIIYIHDNGIATAP